jgi:peptide deformylase
MKMKIIMWPNPALSVPSAPVKDNPSDEVISDMYALMKAAGGVGLSAIQVGIPEQFFILDIGEGLEIYINPDFDNAEGSHQVIEGCLSTPGMFQTVNRYKTVQAHYTTAPHPVLPAGEITPAPPKLEPDQYLHVESLAAHKSPSGSPRWTHHKTLDGLRAHAYQHECEHMRGAMFLDYLSKAERGRVFGEMMKLKKAGFRKDLYR